MAGTTTQNPLSRGFFTKRLYRLNKPFIAAGLGFEPRFPRPERGVTTTAPPRNTINTA